MIEFCSSENDKTRKSLELNSKRKSGDNFMIPIKIETLLEGRKVE